MSMRLKLFLSYLVMGIVPILLVFAVTIGVIYHVISENPFLLSMGENDSNLSRDIEAIMSIEHLMREDPDGIYNRAFLKQVDETLSKNRIGILLLDSDKQVYYASSFLDEKTLLQEISNPLPGYTRRFPSPVKEGEFAPMGYKQLNVQSDFKIFEKPAGKEKNGILYLAIETGSFEKAPKAYMQRYVVLLFSGMAALILILTFLVTRSMMQSLKQLKEGVSHISRGDLDFSIRTDKRDEVAQVVLAFEEMRLRLKASIDAQVKEEENRKELVANISHDLKTPVTSIKGYVEGLIDGVADTPEKKEKYLSTILGKTIALDRMINDLFLYSSLDAGRAGYHFEILPAAEVFEGLCSETRLDLAERGFDVQCGLDIPPEARIRVDRQMILRLQRNLTENAVKYSRESGKKVLFTVSVRGMEIICSTQDNGIGIRPEEMPHIFDRFYRADAARTSTIGGTGLGLQITRRIIEDHGGRIWAESSYGEYTRISWTLPVYREEENSRQDADKQSPEKTGEKADEIKEDVFSEKKSGGGQDAG